MASGKPVMGLEETVLSGIGAGAAGAVGMMPAHGMLGEMGLRAVCL